MGYQAVPRYTHHECDIALVLKGCFMNHQCPARKKSLRFKLVKSKVIPGTGRMEGFAYCPYCKTAIQYHQHPAEKRASTILSIAATQLAITMATHNSCRVGNSLPTEIKMNEPVDLQAGPAYDF